LNIRLRVQRIFASLGYDLQRMSGGERGQNPYLDMKHLSRSSAPILIDVGANVGQTVFRFRSTFADGLIHSFEPSPTTFAELQMNTSGIRNLTLNNCGVGSKPGTLDFIENIHNVMSSFLEPGRDSWGEIKQRLKVPVITLDDYCREKSIGHIDVLKTDTQGFDLEVVKGARDLIAHHRVHLVFMEVNFIELYKNLPELDEIYCLMRQMGFSLVAFYQFHFKSDRASWTDALFVDPVFNPA
jgi:FkbM family methyltransferase